MKKWLQRLFYNKESVPNIQWKREDSIFSFLSSRLDDNGHLTEEANDLPDEEIKDGEIRFAPGLVDAMFSSDDTEGAKKRIAELATQLSKVAYNNNAISKQNFYRLVTQDNGVIAVIDDFLAEIILRALPIKPYLLHYAKDLATKTNQRNAVKFGIAILGLCKNKAVLSDIKILGLHDEFTVYSSIAIANMSDNIENDLWELAQKVDGWGKIQLVDRLARLNIGAPIKDWLLLEGYKNNIMYEYLAFTCAMHGELHNRLDSEIIQPQLFEAAADIIQALIAEYSPAQDIASYPYASQVIHDFIWHAHTQASSVSDFNILHNIKDFLSNLHSNIQGQRDNGWSQDIISNCIIEIVEILNRKNWKMVAYEGLLSTDYVIYWNAKEASERLGIDLWDTVWGKLQQKPLDSISWYDVTHYSKDEHVDQIIAFALEHLPLDELSSDLNTDFSSRDNYNNHASLEYVTLLLENYPNKGAEIIITSLRNPYVRNRNVAINVLHKWGKENWSSDMEEAVKRLYALEPDKDLKENIDRLLNGQELR